MMDAAANPGYDLTPGEEEGTLVLSLQGRITLADA